MKRILNYLINNPINYIFIVFVTLVFNCTEDSHSAHGGESIAPGKVVVNSIENTPGGAIIRFTAPNDPDLLYKRKI
jgi:hypothetical protein